MKAHSTPDYLSDIEESTKQLEEVKKANEMNQREENLLLSFYIDSDKLFKIGIALLKKFFYN